MIYSSCFAPLRHRNICLLSVQFDLVYGRNEEEGEGEDEKEGSRQSHHEIFNYLGLSEHQNTHTPR
jgi:hypothetical protein